jgi:hypothetical protein
VIKILALAFLTVSAGFASRISFTGLPSNTEFGTYNGFAVGSIDGASNQLLICDDFAHTTYVPSSNLVYSLSELVGSNPLQFARFADLTQWSNTIIKYEEAALLLNGLMQNGPGSLLDLTADYQYALWELFTPSVKLPNSTALTLLNDAAYNVAHGGTSNNAIYSELRIYTPDAGYTSNQEFLQMVPNATTTSTGPLATPESSPAIALLIGMGVIALSVVARRKLGRRIAVATSGSIPRESGQ